MSDYVPLGVFWLSLAIVTAGLAEQKHRSRWYWFLWGLLLGPLATALVVVWPSRVAAEANALPDPQLADLAS